MIPWCDVQNYWKYHNSYYTYDYQFPGEILYLENYSTRSNQFSA